MSWNTNIQEWVRKNWVDIAIVAGVLVLALIPRVLDLGTFLTADEKTWMQRSYEYIRAFKDARFNDMLQTTHPGATALWLMGMSVTAKMFVSGIPFSFQTLPSFIVAAQLPIALATSICVAGMYVMLRRIQLPFIKDTKGQYWFAVLASICIALNPLLVGYSRVAHVDALLGSFLFLGVLATILYVQKGYSRTWLVVSAVVSALAFLTKAPAVFLIPFWWLAVLLPMLPRLTIRRDFLIARCRDFLFWTLITGVLFVTIWPVFITVPNPKGNVNILRKDLSFAALTPHHMSEEYTIEGSHYPYTLLTRTTPAIALLALVAIAVTWGAFKRQESPDRQRSVWLLWLFIFFFLVMMTIGAKKGDRYILPVFFGIDVLAAFAVVGGAALVRKSKVGIVLGVVTILYLGGTIYSYHPYAIAYANPLFPDNLSQELGWGEGLEQVAAWLNENDPTARLASWYDRELGMFTTANVLTIGAHQENTVKYVVLYRNMFGRAPDHPANDYIDEYFTKRDPVFVAYVHDKPFAWVYQKQTYPKIFGELLPEDVVTQTLPIKHNPVKGVDVLIATYNGRAVSGSLQIEVATTTGVPIESWTVPMTTIEDDLWHTLLFESGPRVLEEKELVVTVRSIGTKKADAPTLRRQEDGAAAIRVLYEVGGQPVHEEQNRLLIGS